MKKPQSLAIVVLALVFAALLAQAQPKATVSLEAFGKGGPQTVPSVEIIWICDPAPMIDRSQSQVTNIFEGSLMEAALGGGGGTEDRCGDGGLSRYHPPKSSARERSAHSEPVIIVGKGR